MTNEDDDRGLAILVELNEPEALLERIKRIAERRARELAHGLVSAELTAKRWRRLALAIEHAQAELERAPGRDSMPADNGEPEQAA